jgi:hypothetical protein
VDAPEVAARCETVLNTTMAEFDTYHEQRGEDITQVAVEYLDSEIEFYEQVSGLALVTNSRLQQELDIF